MVGRGKNIPGDLKSSIDRLIKSVYDQHGSALVEMCPSNKLSKILEIVNKEKKLEEKRAIANSQIISQNEIGESPALKRMREEHAQKGEKEPEGTNMSQYAAKSAASG